MTVSSVQNSTTGSCFSVEVVEVVFVEEQVWLTGPFLRWSASAFYKIRTFQHDSCRFLCKRNTSWRAVGLGYVLAELHGGKMRVKINHNVVFGWAVKDEHL
jgi:hypothetical protein